jgi:predicted RNase H-like HicB family nuclease
VDVVRYIGVLDGSDDTWGIRIPDLPGCHGGGNTAEAAIEDATSAAREWAEHRKAKGLAMPARRSLDQIIRDGELDVAAAETAVMIPLLLDSGRSVRANLSLDAALLEAIDEAARTRGLTRSGFIASAARDKIMAEG